MKSEYTQDIPSVEAQKKQDAEKESRVWSY